VVDDAQELDRRVDRTVGPAVERSGVFCLHCPFRWARAAAIVGMWKDEHIVRIGVGPLPERDLRSLAVIRWADRSTAPPPALVAASGGNVLFLRELVQSARRAALSPRSSASGV